MAKGRIVNPWVGHLDGGRLQDFNPGGVEASLGGVGLADTLPDGPFVNPIRETRGGDLHQRLVHQHEKSAGDGATNEDAGRWDPAIDIFTAALHGDTPGKMRITARGGDLPQRQTVRHGVPDHAPSTFVKVGQRFVQAVKFVQIVLNRDGIAFKRVGRGALNGKPGVGGLQGLHRLSLRDDGDRVSGGGRLERAAEFCPGDIVRGVRVVRDDVASGFQQDIVSAAIGVFFVNPQAGIHHGVLGDPFQSCGVGNEAKDRCDGLDLGKHGDVAEGVVPVEPVGSHRSRAQARPSVFRSIMSMPETPVPFSEVITSI